ncbi:MAG: cell wall hydrolase [Sulfitobacter sp.]
MRFGLKTWVLAIAVAAAGVPMVAEANSENAKKLARIEQQGLKSVGASRLKSIIDVPTATRGKVKFTRAWLDNQPKASGGPEFRCLAEALYFEARGETVKGQFAVAEVIQNRVKSNRFPGSYCAVINQGTGRKYQCQFTYTCDGHAEVIREPGAYSRVAKIARAVIDGSAPDLVEGATYYHTTAVRPRWASKFTRTAQIGVHLFYRSGKRTASN